MRGLVGILLAITISVVGCSPQEKLPQKPPVTLVRIAYPSIIQNLDPLTDNTLISGSIYGNIYDSLVGRDKEFNYIPALAVRWQNPNDRTWVFDLRHDVTFHDGSPFTSDDVKFSFERMMASSAQQSSSTTVIERVETPDAYTVRFITREPCSNLLSRINGQVVVSRKDFTQNSGHPSLGTNAYRVADWKPGKSITLEAYKGYWGKKPPIERVEFEADQSIEASARKLLNGDLEILPQLNPSALKQFGLENNKNVVVRNYPGLMVLFLSFDTVHARLPGSDLPQNPFRDVRVRKAVYQAINVQRLIRDIQKGYALEATQLMSPLVFGYNGEIQRFAYDPQAALQLLKEAGYPDGFSVRLDLPNNRYRSEVEVGKAIVEDLAKIGIRVELNPQPREEWMKLRDEGRSAFYLAGWAVASGDASGALDYLIHTPDSKYGYGRANSGGYSNAAIDSIIAQSGREGDPKKRLVLLSEAMAMAMEDVAAVPLYIEQNLVAHRSTVEWDPRPDQIISLVTIRPAR